METSGVLWLQTHGHPPEEVLERYSMASSSRDGAAALNGAAALLSEEEHEQVEEHLFLCESCRKQLDECDQWVALMKAAAPLTHGTAVGSTPFWQSWWRTLTEFGSWPALAGGMAMLVAALWIAPAAFSPVGGGVSSVSLSAMRGNDLRVRAQAGAPLELKIEDADVAAGASVSVVDAAGRQVWSGALQGNLVRVPSLKKGSYWVRLMSAGSGEPIKEYGLLVE